MNYTNYLLHEQFIHIEELDTDRFYLKPISVAFGIPITIASFMIVGGLLPMTIIVDQLKKLQHEEVRKGNSSKRVGDAYEIRLGKKNNQESYVSTR